MKNSSLDTYIHDLPVTYKERFLMVFNLFKHAFPSAKIVMSYQMPTFRTSRNLLHIACYSKHIGIYPDPKVIAALKKHYPQVTTSKGTWLIFHDQPLVVSQLKQLAKLIHRQLQ
jgi:uncharacterized protein YdhG (YjbR/CyaY superfamily)